jgi:hypothetical protein
MSEISDRLRQAADRADKIFDLSFASPWREAADEIEHLERQLAEVRAPLGRLAGQLTTGEMSVEEYDAVDIEGAYDMMIGEARAALTRGRGE